MEQSIDLADPQIFGNDAAEDESPAILAGYFLEHPFLREFFGPEERIQIVRARKGMGKSAALSKLAYDLGNAISAQEDADMPLVTRLTGADLLGLGDLEGTDWARLQNQWKCLLIDAATIELARRLRVVPPAQMSTRELATLRGQHLGVFLANRIRQNASPGVTIHEPSVVWYLVDDIDSTFEDNDVYRARVSTFFSACRQLARDIEGIRIRASVRSDVWTSLRKNEDLDKCEQYVADLRWNRRELQRILLKRILAYVRRRVPSRLADLADPVDLDLYADRISDLVFVRRMKWGEHSGVPPFFPLAVLSAGRPRWLAQLCRLASRHTARRKAPMIGMGDIQSAMTEYGRLRSSDLYKEHQHQFAHLQRLVEAFRRGRRRYSYTQLELRIVDSYVFPTGQGGIPPIDGTPYRHPKQLAAFLYKINFLQARGQAPSDGAPPEFMSHDEHPELLAAEETEASPYPWEVHPAYRTSLDIR